MKAEATGNFDGKHLVIFGCGYIGGELARQAVERGLRVTALTRNAGTAAALRALGVTTVEAELSNEGWHGQVGQADWAVNCVSSGGGGPDAYRRSYLAGMKSVLSWSAQQRTLDTLVYTSSTSVYPQGGGVTVDETMPATGRDERTTLLVETETALLRATTGRRRVVLRLAGIYGPGRTHLLKQVQAGEVAGLGPQHLNLIHRDDVCGALWVVLGGSSAPAKQIFNVVDDSAATKAEITTWLAGQMDLPMPRFTGEPAGGRTPVPDRVISNARLKAALGWSPRWPSYREGYANLLSR